MIALIPIYKDICKSWVAKIYSLVLQNTLKQ